MSSPRWLETFGERIRAALHDEPAEVAGDGSDQERGAPSWAELFAATGGAELTDKEAARRAWRIYRDATRDVERRVDISAERFDPYDGQ